MPSVANLAERIIKEQEAIIGPLAWREAEKVAGLKVAGKKVGIEGDSKDVLGKLVGRYEGLFGPASVEVCRDAVKALIPDMAAADVPDVLR